MRPFIASLAFFACALVVDARADSPPPAAAPPAAAPTMLSETVPLALGDVLEGCIDRALMQHFVMFQQRFGSPEAQRDTIVSYSKERQTIHLAMYGSAATSDDAKKRLESRKPAVDFAVQQCAKRIGKKPEDVLSTIEFTYSQIDRENGKQKPLLRWYRGRWELL